MLFNWQQPEQTIADLAPGTGLGITFVDYLALQPSVYPDQLTGIIQINLPAVLRVGQAEEIVNQLLCQCFTFHQQTNFRIDINRSGVQVERA